MKQIIKIFNFFILITISLILTCCNKSDLVKVRTLDTVKDELIIREIDASDDPGIPFPPGSTATSAPGGAINITLPIGYNYIYVDPVTGAFLGTGPGTSVTCNCTSGTDCSPVERSGKYYCVMGPTCNLCSKKTTSNGKEVKITGIYSQSFGISFISSSPEGENGTVSSLAFSKKNELLGNATSSLFAIPDVQDEILNVYNFIYNNNIPAFITHNSNIIPAGYKFVEVSIYGNLALLTVPAAMVDNRFVSYETTTGAGGHSCSCLSGTSGCIKNSLFGAKFCEAGNCKTCKLTSAN